MPYFDDSEDRNDIKAAFCAEVGAQLFDGHNALRRVIPICALWQLLLKAEMLHFPAGAIIVDRSLAPTWARSMALHAS